MDNNVFGQFFIEGNSNNSYYVCTIWFFYNWKSLNRTSQCMYWMVSRFLDKHRKPSVLFLLLLLRSSLQKKKVISHTQTKKRTHARIHSFTPTHEHLRVCGTQYQCLCVCMFTSTLKLENQKSRVLAHPYAVLLLMYTALLLFDWANERTDDRICFGIVCASFAVVQENSPAFEMLVQLKHIKFYM